MTNRLPEPWQAPQDAAPAPLPLWLAAVHTLLVGLATLALAWHAGALSPSALGIWLLALGAAVLAVLAARRGRIAHLELCMLEAAAVATASAATGALALHLLFKPAALIIALFFVAVRAYAASATAHFDPISWAWLCLALLASLAGDVFLMLRDWFVPGLASFLLAHLAYIALFKRHVAWFGDRTALLATMVVGAAMYAWLWHHGLPQALRVPVALYVLAIALMAAQALGSASQLRSAHARTVALGACLFMLSDAVLAADRFVQPLPAAPLWVLGSYYAAQFCIVYGVVRQLRCAGAAQRR